MVQTEIAAGLYRFAVRDVMGNYRAYTEGIPYNILDANTAPRAALVDTVEGNPEGQINDRIVAHSKALVAYGSSSDILALEYFDSAAHATTVTASFTCSLNVADAFRDIVGIVRVVDKPLTLADRVTKTIAGTNINSALGLDDNPAWLANTWNGVLYFVPPFGHNWSPRGYQRFVSSST